jgi:glycosyltransferase involved in cell wall biosynthesis
MRIGFDALLLDTPTPSGVEQAVLRTLQAVLAEDSINEYVVFHAGATPPLAASPRARCVRVLPDLLRGRISRILWQQAIEPCAALRRRLDVLHAPAYVAPVTPLPCALVLTVYDTLALKRPDLCKRLNTWHYRLIMRRAARRAAAVVTPTDYVARDAAQWLGVPPERVVRVPPPLRPIPPEAISEARCAAVRRRYGLPDPFILFLGNVEPKKNVATLVRAFAALKREGRTPHRLVIAGRWAWKHQDVSAAIRQEGMEGTTVRLGYVDDADVPALMRLADLFAFPSIEEGLGMPPLEAMACGVPVVASDAACLPEALGDAALLVPPDDARQLKTAMDKALHNRFLRETLTRRGLERVSRYDARASARRLIEVYAEAAASRRAGRPGASA